ncbi:hypothetical protein [Brevundimonas sp.]|uniref:hypothetical protein n=1 Tax=Brevundimonas sp. TaxID=1871086 RepID=UPI00286B9ECC|nr:hypothetical protein [Brevundimonas sp.]
MTNQHVHLCVGGPHDGQTLAQPGGVDRVKVMIEENGNYVERVYRREVVSIQGEDRFVWAFEGTTPAQIEEAVAAAV